MLPRLNDLLKRYHSVGSWLLILAAFAAYRGALACGFVYDDVSLILQNPFVKNPHLWKRIFLGSLFSFDGLGGQTGYYRPLSIFSYWIICRVAGFNTGAYHLVLLVLYALSVWMVYRIGRKLLQNELAAFSGALLWALHPLHVEVVAWICSLNDIGCTLFCLLGFWLFLRAEKNSGMQGHIAAAAVYFPALFFKEMALSFPLLLLAYWFCQPSAESWRRRALHWLPYVAAVALCGIIRAAVMVRFSGPSSLHSFNARMVLPAIAVLGQHAKLFFWPVQLSNFRGFNLSASLHSPWPWITLLVLLAACVWRHRDPPLSFLLLWWAVALLPCLNYYQLTTPIVADRYSYLGSVGLCLALGHLAFGLVPQHQAKPGPSYAIIAALAIVASLWAAQTVRYVPHWRDNDTLFDYALRTSPSAAEAHVAHGVVLQFREHDLKGAAQEFRTALQLNEQTFRPILGVTYTADIGLGQVALMQGHESEALAYFNKAVHVLPNSTFAYHVLGAVYFPGGNYDRAAEYFQQAVRLNPMDTAAEFYLGTCWMKLGKPAEAAQQFHAAREVDPDYTQAYAAEAAALRAAGDPAGAAEVRRLMAQH